MGKYSEFFMVFENMLICKTCNWAIPKPKDCTTSSLRHHLKKKHPELYSAFKDKDDRTKTERSLAAERAVALAQGLQRNFKSEPETGGPSTSAPSPRQPIINPCIVPQMLNTWDPDREQWLLTDRAITQIICTAVLPPSILDNPGFRNLLAVTAPRYQLKPRAYFTENGLSNLYEEYYAKIKKMLDSANFVSLSSDVRYLPEGKDSLVAITAHFIDNDMIPRFMVVAVTLIPNAPTSDDMKTLLSKVLNLYDVKEEKLHALVEHSSLGIARNASCIKSLDGFSQKLQKAVEEGLALLLYDNETLLDRLKQISQHLWKHDPAKQIRTCSAFCAERQRNAKEISMCWSCLYQLLCRMEEEKNSLTFVLAENYEWSTTLNGNDWDLMRKIIATLKPIDFAVGLVKHRFFTPISVVIPLYKVIVRQLQGENSLEKRVQEAMCRKLTELMEGCEMQEELFLATFVDPRFRGAYFAMDKRQAFLEKIEEMAFLPVQQPVQVVEPSFEDFSNPFVAFRKCESQEPFNNLKLEAGTKALAELEDYLSQDPSFSVDPYEFWRNDVNAAKYPLIKKLALKYLSAPGIAIECQSVFAQLECITGQLRNIWEQEDLEILLFLHHNILIYGF